MKIYYLHNGASQSGPFDIEELKQKGITKETPIWYQGLNEWTTAGEIAELSAVFQSTPPPLKTAPPSYTQTKVINDLTPAPRNRKPLLYIGIAIAVGVAIFFGVKNNEAAAKIAVIEQKANEQAQQQAIVDQQQAELEKQNLEFRNNWEKYILFKNGKPQIAYLLGGISEFQVAVGNRTNCILDQVDLSIEYIRKNGDIYKTETVSFYNVNPNAFEKGTAPSSINGVDFKIAITKIISRKMNFCYPSNNGNEADPYYCK
jgi:hypothetical protein